MPWLRRSFVTGFFVTVPLFISVAAFIASALVVKPFLHYVRRSGFAPFAWYRIAIGFALLAAAAAGWM